MKNTINLFAFSFFLASLAGCSTVPPMKVAINELGTSSKSEYAAHDLRIMMRSINITGLTPEETVGATEP